MRYRTLRTIHFWLCLVVALPLVVLSLTGAVLVYGPELQRLLSPGVWTVEARGTVLPPSEIVARVAEQKPEVRLWSLSAAKAPDRAVGGWLGGGAGMLTIDPYDGTVLSHHHPKETFEGWVTALHRRLLVDGPAAPWVRHGVSAVALVLIAQLIAGLALWLKPRNPLKRLGVPLRQGPRLAIIRLHQETGIAMAVILFVVAFTGMAMYWVTPTRAVVEWATWSAVGESDPPGDAAKAPVDDLDAAIAHARASLPADATLLHYRLPRHDGDSVMAAFRIPSTIVPVRLWVGGSPPRVLYRHGGAEVSRAGWLWHLRYQIHIGDFAGPIVRALWVVVALLPTAFVVSGLWLHLGRRRREVRGRESRDGAARSAPASSDPAGRPVVGE